MDEYFSHLRTCGISLSTMFIDDVAMTRIDALKGVDLLLAARTPILGGDVFLATEKNVRHAYANWCVHRDRDEAFGNFVACSAAEARAYIENYPEPKVGQSYSHLFRLPKKGQRRS